MLQGKKKAKKYFLDFYRFQFRKKIDNFATTIITTFQEKDQFISGSFFPLGRKFFTMCHLQQRKNEFAIKMANCYY